VNRYFRTYVDNAGNRVEMEGGVAAGQLTLVGTQAIPRSPETKVRLIWERVGGGCRPGE
jgi:hypothetical protein